MSSINQQLLDAALKGDLATVEKLASQGADVNYTDQWGNSAVFSAAWEGHIEALELYYRLGAKLDTEDANPFCNAAYNGQAGSVKWFLEKGVDPNFSFSKT